VLAIAACTYQNPVGVAPAFDVPRYFEGSETPAVGNYVLVVDPDGARLSRTVRASGLSCPWDTYPVSIRLAAPKTARGALAQVFHRIEFANAVPTNAEMLEAFIDGAITVRVERFATRLTFEGSMPTGVATTEFAVRATLNSSDGRGYATSARSIKTSSARPGSECRGARVAVGRSIELAMQDAFEQVAAGVSRFEENSVARRRGRGTTRPRLDQAARQEPKLVVDEDARRIARDRRIATKRQVDAETLPFPPRDSGAAPAALPPRLTPAQIDSVRGQILKCLIDARFHDAKIQSVAIWFQLNPDGSLASLPEIADTDRLRTDASFRVLTNRAWRALIACSPLKGLPRESYEHWREMTLAFDAQDFQPK